MFEWRNKIPWDSVSRTLRRNAGLRLISILLAVGLWIFVNAGQRNAVIAMAVPISYRSLAPGMVIMNHPPEFVKIEVTGPRTLLSLLDPERLTLRLNLQGVPIGHSDFKITPAMFNVPRQTTVTRIAPDEAQLDIDRVISRELPVHVDVQGVVASDSQINLAQAQPAEVAVSGPSRYVAPLNHIETEPFDVSGANSDIERAIGLESPSPDVHVAMLRVLARVDIGEKITSREFKDVDVEVRDTDHKYKVEPAKVTITLRGPETKLDSLDPSGIAFVDAADGSPGSRELPLQIDLPSGTQLVKQQPNKVRLHIYRQKREMANDGNAS